MSATAKRTISLPPEHAAYVDAKVASGDYASVSEVVREGLRSLKARDDAIEAWMRGPVVETYDKMRKDPSRGIPVEEAFDIVMQRVHKL
jgi:antitoxin ParD1/3/4